MRRRTRNISSLLLAATILVSVPVLIGAQALRSTPLEKSGPRRVESRQLWDGKVQGRQVVTPIAVSFEDAEAYRDFLAGRIPFTLTLRSLVSGQTVRLPSAALTEGLRPAPGNRAVWAIAIDDVLAPLWNANGCIDTSLSAEATGEGSGAAITVTYAPCGGATAAQARPGQPIPNIIVRGGRGEAQQIAAARPIRCPQDPICQVLLGITEEAQAAAAARPGATIPGVGIVVKKNPGGGAARVVVSSGASEVGEGEGEGDGAGRLQRGRADIVLVRASRGSASPRPRGL